MLPMVFKPALVFSRLALVALFFSLFTSSAHALAPPQPPPDPLPCQNPIVPDEEILTHHWMANDNREPPPQVHKQTITVIGPAGPINVSEPIEFTVDFSKLGALFGPTNSDYNEGEYQEKDHKNANISELEPVDISKYNGPGQKAGNQVMLDAVRVKYVDYIWRNSHLPEASDDLTNTNGDNPRRIYDMRNDFGEQLPDLDPNTSNPTPPSYGGNKNDWQNTWGQYWNKIPTTYDEFYKAYIVFREESNSNGGHIDKVLNGQYCPDWLDEKITFVIPKYFRTTTTSGQLNQLIVPKVAQSHNSNDLILKNKDADFLEDQKVSRGVLGKIIDTCLKAFKNNPVSNSLRKVIGYINDFLPTLNPSQTVYAQSNQTLPSSDPDSCMRILIDGKEGQDAYCAFNPSLQDDDIEYTCTNKIDQYKLDSNNENVICTFKIKWEPKHNPMTIPEVGNKPDDFDSCTPIPGTVLYRCQVEVSIWPIFKIPWTTEIWNNTLFSDVKESEPFIGSDEFQQFGRPGVYSWFTPNVIFKDEESDATIKLLRDMLSACDNAIE